MEVKALTSPAFAACLKWLRSNPRYYAITEHLGQWPAVEFWDDEMAAVRFIICVDDPRESTVAYETVKFISSETGRRYRTETGAELSVIAEVFCPEQVPFRQD